MTDTKKKRDQEHNVEACYAVTNEYGLRHVPTMLIRLTTNTTTGGRT